MPSKEHIYIYIFIYVSKSGNTKCQPLLSQPHEPQEIPTSAASRTAGALKGVSERPGRMYIPFIVNTYVLVVMNRMCHLAEQKDTSQRWSSIVPCLLYIYIYRKLHKELKWQSLLFDSSGTHPNLHKDFKICICIGTCAIVTTTNFHHYIYSSSLTPNVSGPAEIACHIPPGQWI